MQVTIGNYKSIGNASIELRPGLNILIGPNGSGKTSLLSALQFLRDVFRVGAAQALALQGGARLAFRHGQSEMCFSLTQPYGDRIYRRRKTPCQLSWHMVIAQAGPEKLATIVDEKVDIVAQSDEGEARLFSVEIQRSHGAAAQAKAHLASPAEFGRDLFDLWQQEFRDKSKEALPEVFLKHWAQRRLKRLKQQPDRSCMPLLADLDRDLEEVTTIFRFLSEYNILPDIARASTEQLPFAQMSPNGHAVSEVIDALAKRRYERLAQPVFVDAEEAYGAPYYYHPYEYWRRYRADVGPHRRRGRVSYDDALEGINQELAAAVKPITHVSVAIDPSNGKRFVMFNSEHDTFYPQEVSDGTVKWLCILVSLFVPFSRVYLLEEPENFLHPWMQQRLISIMREQARRNETIFLLASHSATILNAAFADEILIVKQGSKGTEVSAVQDVQSVAQALADSEFHLGDLWVSGAIGGVPAYE